VEAEGQMYRQPGRHALRVTSGIDWFELHGEIEFDGLQVDLPALLAAVRRGSPFVRLGDGTFGLLPEEWLDSAAKIVTLGTAEADHVRFAPSQAALLDAWLESQPEVSCDEAFARLRTQLAAFEGISDVPVPATFVGDLRAYQREALGWFAFL